ncbi:dTMP kinase [Myxococcaceae bacterium]|nr:dTMP kinase [Myxococcaceae bacterium]
MNPGRLIVFEGLDGSGKSTQLARLAVRLRERGERVVETREPTQGPHGRRIRQLAAEGRRAPPAQELALFVADRREHVASVIEPALRDRCWILCDRYFLSTAAYQGARGLAAEQILAESEAEFPLPALALLFDLAPARCLERVHARGGVETAFERLDRLERVAEIFARLERPYLMRIDADASEAEVERRVAAALSERFGEGP